MRSQEIIFDASGQVLGRLASRVALHLQGKDQPDFLPNRIPQRKVIVINTDQIRLTGQKKDQKLYWHYSGYPGGIKSLPLKKLLERDSGEVLRRAVYGMLPPNKLRKKMMSNLYLYPAERPVSQDQKKVKK